MKIIRVSNDADGLKITTHDFPEGKIKPQNDYMYGLIDNDCDTVERVSPVRLYKMLGHHRQPTNIDGQCVCMLIDECSAIKPNRHYNSVGSYLYGTDMHGCPIFGNILFVGECWEHDEISFCGIEEKTFEKLHIQLSNIAFALKEFAKLRKGGSKNV